MLTTLEISLELFIEVSQVQMGLSHSYSDVIAYHEANDQVLVLDTLCILQPKIHILLIGLEE
jgi:hypothetical protein